MDTLMTRLPPNVGAILMENISIIQIVSMFSIGAYNAVETGIVTFDSFKRYRGLYFWSMPFASWGILVHAIPAMARFISRASNLPTSIPFMIGWDKNPQDIVAIPCHLVTVCVNESSKLSLGADLFFFGLG
jgi:hypothetical protein